MKRLAFIMTAVLLCSTAFAQQVRVIDINPDIDIDVDVKDNVELTSFLTDVWPTYDKNRVYVSDIKKLVSWYKLLLEKTPEVFEEEKKLKEEAEKKDKEKE